MFLFEAAYESILWNCCIKKLTRSLHFCSAQTINKPQFHEEVSILRCFFRSVGYKLDHTLKFKFKNISYSWRKELAYRWLSLTKRLLCFFYYAARQTICYKDELSAKFVLADEPSRYSVLRPDGLSVPLRFFYFSVTVHTVLLRDKRTIKRVDHAE